MGDAATIETTITTSTYRVLLSRCGWARVDVYVVKFVQAIISKSETKQRNNASTKHKNLTTWDRKVLLHTAGDWTWPKATEARHEMPGAFIAAKVSCHVCTFQFVCEVVSTAQLVLKC